MNIPPPSRPEIGYIQPESRTKRRKWRPRPLSILLLILLLIALAHFVAVTRATYRPAAQQATNCTTLIHGTDYTKYIPPLSKTQEMDAVQFIDRFTGGRPSALIQVNDTREESLLDVYVYGCSMQKQRPVLDLLFKEQGLIQGSATVTRANTLSIGQRDNSLTPESSTALLPLQENVYREYIWQDKKIQQINFPGLYPSTSRSEAEALQEQVNYGQPLAWKDPMETAKGLAQDVFAWPENEIEAIQKSKTNTTVQVQLKREVPKTEINVTLEKLVDTGEQGIWTVTRAQSEGITLDTGQYTAPMGSPLAIKGKIEQPKAKVEVSLLDHTMTRLKILNNASIQAQDDGKFSGTIAFNNHFPNQPGLLLIRSTVNSDNEEQTYLLLEHLLIA